LLCAAATVGWRLSFKLRLLQLQERLAELAARVGMVRRLADVIAVFVSAVVAGGCCLDVRCGPSEWRLLFRFTLAQLQERLAEAAARVGMVRRFRCCYCRTACVSLLLRGISVCIGYCYCWRLSFRLRWLQLQERLAEAAARVGMVSSVVCCVLLPLSAGAWC
jgi:hypothetical protein